MKKIVALFITITMLMLLLSACSQQSAVESTVSAGPFDPAQIETVADLLPYLHESTDNQSCTTEEEYIVAFKAGDVYYRAEAEMTKGLYSKIEKVEYDEDHDATVEEMLSPLKVVSIENLSEKIPSQEELDKLIGATGQELFDDEWTYWFYDLDEMKAGLYHGLFAYDVEFNYDGDPMENTDDFDFYKEFADLTVKSVTFSGLGDAADPEAE